MLRDLLRARPDIKLVLMSATLNAQVFASYFGGDASAPTVHIPGITYPVNEMYLEDLIRATRHHIPPQQQRSYGGGRGSGRSGGGGRGGKGGGRGGYGREIAEAEADGMREGMGDRRAAHTDYPDEEPEVAASLKNWDETGEYYALETALLAIRYIVEALPSQVGRALCFRWSDSATHKSRR